MIPGLGKIKTALLAVLSIASAILFGLFEMSRVGRANDKLKAAKKANEIQQSATDVITEGEKKREEIQNADDADMRRFGDQ